MPLLKPILTAAFLLICTTATNRARAQTTPRADSMIARIRAEGTDRSQLYRISQVLSDSIGPRLSGTPGLKAGNDWLVSQYRSWGIPARLERFGTWRGWKRGVSHADLISPRVRSLEATLLAWSPGTSGARVEGPVVILADAADSAAFMRWLPAVKGRIVLMSAASTSCRPDADLATHARPATLAAMREQRAATTAAWNARVARTGSTTRTLPRALERAGAVGILTNTWAGGWGSDRIFRGRANGIPTFDVSCEDYGLLYRLAENNQGPIVRLRADASWQGTVPMFNAVAEIRGAEKPEEYVFLSAHFDTWEGASGSTDNGTGTAIMLEAMRILRTVYPNPRRTIIAGHWSGEEQGLIGSRAFSEDHPEVVSGLHALFNQDNGTGRIESISSLGLPDAGAHLERWMASVPLDFKSGITLQVPGTPSSGGTDHAAFVCHGAPAFDLESVNWSYNNYTWHTNRDTFDKIVMDDLRDATLLTAMLVYLASEDDTKITREKTPLVSRTTGLPVQWPACSKATRSWESNAR
ncbi:MAG: M20/M25/M40 family metallo-hydrolase [Gemmatimonadaceae bacterium]|nr:M20/M25/M40 family metallo-hydrolase [Gemmatimonadaceae bacterium]